jgi:hypothetical protein
MGGVSAAGVVAGAASANMLGQRTSGKKRREDREGASFERTANPPFWCNPVTYRLRVEIIVYVFEHLIFFKYACY